MKGQNRISSTSNCFQVVTVQMKLNLSPAYIGRLKEGIWLKLTNYLMKYSFIYRIISNFIEKIHFLLTKFYKDM